MSATDQPRLIPGAVAGVCLALTLTATVWSAKPLYGPLRREFGWPAWLVIGFGAASILVTGGLFRRCERAANRYGVRALATLSCLGAGLLLLLALPNLTHVWQLAGVLLILGVTRAAVAAAAWKELRRCAGVAGAALAVCACAGVSLGLFTPWIAEIVYRNSWREGAAACAGVMLLLATPSSYVLLPGVEVVTVVEQEPQQR